MSATYWSLGYMFNFSLISIFLNWWRSIFILSTYFNMQIFSATLKIKSSIEIQPYHQCV